MTTYERLPDCGAFCGDVSGPGTSVTNNAIVLWDTTAGTLVKDSTMTIAAVQAATVATVNATYFAGHCPNGTVSPVTSITTVNGVITAIS